MCICHRNREYAIESDIWKITYNSVKCLSLDNRSNELIFQILTVTFKGKFGESVDS